MAEPHGDATAVAIIGMAGRFPGARNVEEFWQNLVVGKETISRLTDEELVASGIPRETFADPHYVKARGILEDADLFDAPFFGFTPREAELTDPQHRVFLETCWEALENAGHDAESQPGAVGVYGGLSMGTYLLSTLARDPEFVRELVQSYQIGSYPAVIGNDYNFLTTRVAYKLNLKGPAITVQTGCSTSLVAVCLAARALLHYECDLALAGGVSITFPQKRGYAYQEGAMGSVDGRCRAFDANARGTVFGGGAAVVVLKRLSDALADGDSVRAVIKGFAMNNDGASKVGYMAPSVEGQADVIVMALAQAGVQPATIRYVETHGTGTPLGDPIEVAALTKAFRTGTASRGFCAIGSVKPNVGHLDVASGVTGLIKATLALERGKIPPSLHYETPNPAIDFDGSPFYVNAALQDWPAGAGAPRRAGVSAFGVGGTNAHVVLEEAPATPGTSLARPEQVVVLSARTDAALETATRNIAKHIEGHPELSLAEVAHTLQVGRRAFAHRRMLVCNTLDEAREELLRPSPGKVMSRVVERSGRPVAFLFPGQGSQHVGMGLELHQTESRFRQELAACAEVLRPELGVDPVDLLYPTREKRAEAAERLDQTEATQPLLFAVEYALAKLWEEWGVRPQAMLGHSLGEYVAACLAGVFSLEDALRLLAARARMMQALPRGAMIAARIGEAEARDLSAGDLSLAAVNGPRLSVLSGTFEAVDRLIEVLEGRKVPYRRLKTSHAFHSAMLEPMAEAYLREIQKVRLSPPRIPFVSGVTGNWITVREATAADYWVRQFREPVRFAQGLELLRAEPDRVLLEVGPDQTLSTLARGPQFCPAGDVLASLPGEGKPERRFLCEALGRLWLAGAPVDWSGFHRRERRRRVPLPTYPFEKKRHWIESTAASRPADAAAEEAPAPGTAVAEQISAPAPGDLARPPAAPPGGETAAGRGEEPGMLSAVCRLLSELSGLPPGDIATSRTFLELGFDSLFLTQASQELRKKFGVKVSFRQLLGDLGTPDALAAHLTQAMPPESLPPEASSAEAAAAAGWTPPAGEAIASGELPGPFSAANDEAASALERIVARQLDLMKEQLALLRGEPTGAATMDRTASPEKPAIDPSPVPAARSAESRPLKPFGPYKPIEKGSSPGLTERQRLYLQEFAERYTRRTPESKRLTEQARTRFADPRVVAGFRLDWKEIVYPIVTVRSSGSKLWDVDGNEYVDLLMGYGLNFFGHSPAFVTEAVAEQLRKGVEIGPQSPIAGRVADLLCELTGMDRATFCNTGSEAVMAALRIARTVTGRDRIALFTGSYHGTFDEVLVRGVGADEGRRSLPIAPGIPQAKVDNVLVLEYGTEESLRVLEKEMPRLAAVLVEPVQSRHPDLQPREFLQQLRRSTERAGTALIFDEVITGFRTHPGGAQALFGIRADIATYGKVIGGGMPIGAVAGRSVYMDALDGGTWRFGDESVPEAGVTFFAGTFVRHPLAMAAALAVLTHLKEKGPALQEDLNARAARFAAALNARCERHGVPMRVQQFCSILFFSFPADQRLLGLLYYHLREKGVHIWEGFPCFLTTAHTDEDLDFVLQAFDQSVMEMQEGELLPRTLGSLESCPASLETSPSESAPAPLSIPLTEPQKEIWLAAQMGADASCAFNESLTLRLTGGLNLGALRRAFQKLGERHDALRMTFSADGREQRVAPAITVPLVLTDLADLPSDEAEAAFGAHLEGEARQPFDLTAGPLLRAHLFRTGDGEHRLALTAHHIVCDGWSTNVLLDELATLYSAETNGAGGDLPPVKSFAEYAVEQAAVSERRVQAEAYWIAELAGPPPPLELPTDRPRPPVKSYVGATARRKISRGLSAAVKAAGAARGCTYFTTLLGAFGALLHRLTGQEDVVVGIPAAGQSAEGREGLVGHCVNFLPLRLRAEGNPAWGDYLSATRRKVLDAYDNQDTTYGALIPKLALRRDPSRLPLVEVQFNLERVGTGLSFAGLEAHADPNPKSFVNFDLFFNLIETPDRLILDCDYNTDLFDTETVERWLGHYETLLGAVSEQSSERVFSLPVLSERERQEMLVEWNQTDADYPRQATLTDLFEAQARRTPDALAVEGGSEKLTYRELDDRANQIARRLTRLGAAPGVVVGVCMDRTVYLVAALLGVLKSGAAYLPLDPADPSSRLAETLSDAGAELVLSEAATARSFVQPEGRVVFLDPCGSEVAAESTEDIPALATPADLAYVIYTSGSTGRPKGVAVPHRSIVNLLWAMRRDPGLTPADRLLAVTTVCFDIAALEIFLPLIVGARTVLASREAAADGEQMLGLMEASGITVLQGTPATWKLLIEAGWRDRKFKMLCGGEALTPDLARELLARGASLWNMYGPTETTVWSSARRLEEPESPVRIGPPIANTRFYVLDRYRSPVPIGSVGELYIGGDGLATGYHRQPALTAERFLADPFGAVPSARLYRTGDLARWHRDRTLQLLGRTDRQVKLRGFRIELGEVEAALQGDPDVAEAAAILQEEHGANPKLVAYVAPRAATDRAASGSKADWAHQMRSQWEAQYEAAIAEGGSVSTGLQDPTLNIFAWSGLQNVEGEVGKWLDHTARRVLALRPGRVLEIGCGTGSLLEKLLPQCQSYYGTDISQAALDHLRVRVSRAAVSKTKVRLEKRDASDFAGLEPGSFDTVIINSVVEYLPGVEHLLRVLEGAVRSVRPGGSVFLGDVPSLPLLEGFQASEQLERAPEGVAAEAWRHRVRHTLWNAGRLAVDPDLFRALPQWIPRITQVEIHIQRGDFESEISRLHADAYFDAVLHVECEAPMPRGRISRNWEKDRLNPVEVRRLLAEERPDALIVTGMPNRRLLRVARTVEILRGSEGGTVATLRSRLTGIVGVDPEEIHAAARDLPYRVEMTWSVSGRDGRCDLLFQRDLGERGKRIAAGHLREAARLRPWAEYANDPAAAMGRRLLARGVRDRLRATLPGHMLPSAISVLEALPRTRAGKIDYSTLAQLEGWEQDPGQRFVAPRDEVEVRVARIWEHVLGVSPIGTADDFFALGGHSFLAMALFAEMEKAFGRRLPLATLFQAPTVGGIAAVLRGDDAAASWSCLVPISSKGSRPPFYCVHAVGGNVLTYAHLARRLAPEQPVYGLQAAGLDGRQPSHQTIEEMARHYAAEIRRFQPEGPYAIGGTSAGGLVAYEVARQLETAGAKVALLALFDTHGPNSLTVRPGVSPRRLKAYGWLDRFLLHFENLLVAEKWAKAAYVVEKSRRLEAQLLRRWRLRRRPLPPALQKVQEAVWTAIHSYVPGPYNGRVTLFRAQRQPRGYLADPTLGWDRLAMGGVDVREVPGRHGALIFEPRVGPLADTLRACLERAFKGPGNTSVEEPASPAGAAFRTADDDSRAYGVM